MMAARIEFEKEWLPKFSRDNLATPKKNFNLNNSTKNTTIKNKALSNIGSKGLKNMLDNL